MKIRNIGILFLALLIVAAATIMAVHPTKLKLEETIDMVEVNNHGVFEITDEEKIDQLVGLINKTAFRKRLFSQYEAPNNLIATTLLMQDENVVASIVVCGTPEHEEMYVLYDNGAYVAYDAKKVVACIDGLIDQGDS